MEAKESVVRRFLGFLSQWVSLPQARLATLGGMGVEAQAWVEAGIPPSHGSLIELESGLARILIKKFDYRTHDRLSAFHTVLGNYGEMVDGFHLDLCGTFNVDVLGDFSPTLPFILRSRGKCLAVTVADARQNRALSNWPACRARGKELLGRRVQPIFAELEAQQRKIPVKVNTSLPKFFRSGFDPHKAAKREFAFMLDILELAQAHKCTVQSMERLVYVSRYNNRAFRMRTYLFHFGLGCTDDSLPLLVQTWLASPLAFTDQDSTTIIAAVPAKPQEKHVTSKLAELVALTGNQEIQEEYAKLVSDSESLSEFRRMLNGGGSKASAKPAANGEAKPPRKKFTDLSPAEQLEFRLKVLKARTEFLSTGSLSNWAKSRLPEVIKAELGHVPKDFSHQLGAYLARMNGKFRPDFIESVKKTLPPNEADDYIARLNTIPV